LLDEPLLAVEVVDAAAVVAVVNASLVDVVDVVAVDLFTFERTVC